MLKPIGLSDHQLRLITEAARPLAPDLRGKFLQLVWEQLKIKTVGVQDAIARALNYLQPVEADMPDNTVQIPIELLTDDALVSLRNLGKGSAIYRLYGPAYYEDCYRLREWMVALAFEQAKEEMAKAHPDWVRRWPELKTNGRINADDNG